MRAEHGLQVVIASTGRSGTTWLQLLLSHLYDAVPTGARDFDPASGRFRPEAGGGVLAGLRRRSRCGAYDDWPNFWRSLPVRAIVHSHWHAHPPVAAELKQREVPVVTMTRHPFDVLISHLAWVNRNPGIDPNLSFLAGATPLSKVFLDFAAGDLARWLLSISGGWWLREGVVGVRYEDLRRDTAGELQRVVDALGLATSATIGEAVEGAELKRLRQAPAGIVARLLPQRQRAALYGLRRAFQRRGARDAFVAEHRERKHFWHGQPGLWRSFLPAEQAAHLGAVHTDLLKFFQYQCDPDPALTPAQAEANWRRLV